MEEQEQEPRERSFVREWVPDWRPTREQMLWAVRIVIVLVLLLGILTLIGWPFGITLWEWLKLLVVPAVIAAGGIWFNRQQRERELAIAERRTKEDRKIAQERAETDRQIAEQRRQDDILQAYLDQMGQLLLDKDRPLRKSKEGDEIRTLARARTLTVLELLDAARKTSVLRFLTESWLVQKEEGANEEHVTSQPVVSLSRADLREADLTGAYLVAADLDGAKLSEAILFGTNLVAADLNGADLTGAYLVAADLSSAEVNSAKLSSAILNLANLSNAELSFTDLSGVYLRGADLSEANLLVADLSRADLNGARGVTNEELDQEAKSLEGATMPDGQKYEDWLKSKGHRDREHGENGGTS